MSFGYNPPTGFDAADDIADALRHKRAVAGHQHAQADDTHVAESFSLNNVSPRDPQTGLPTGQVWDDTDIVHVVGRPELGDSGTHEVGHVRGVIQKRLPGTSAENFTPPSLEVERVSGLEPGSDGPTPNESMSLNFEEVKQQIHTDPRDMFSEVVADQSPGDDMVGAHANTVTLENCLVSSVVASDVDVDGDVQAEGVWQDDWESPIA